VYGFVGRLFAGLVMRGKVQSPDDISLLLGIEPHYAHRLGDPILSKSGKVVGERVFNYWSYSSSSSTNSKDLNDHLTSLLDAFLPLTSIIGNISKLSNVYIFASWESSRVIFGAGPIISSNTSRGIGSLGVELHFDIYCSLKHDHSRAQGHRNRDRR
jgi:uncharacterized protein DUF4279